VKQIILHTSTIEWSTNLDLVTNIDHLTKKINTMNFAASYGTEDSEGEGTLCTLPPQRIRPPAQPQKIDVIEPKSRSYSPLRPSTEKDDTHTDDSITGQPQITPDPDFIRHIESLKGTPAAIKLITEWEWEKICRFLENNSNAKQHLLGPIPSIKESLRFMLEILQAMYLESQGKDVLTELFIDHLKRQILPIPETD
jgi:hypothetical protein